MNGHKPKKYVYDNQEEVRDFILKYIKKNLFRHFSRIYVIGSLSKGNFGKYNEEYEGFFGSDIDLVVIPKQNMNNFKYEGEYHDWHEYFAGAIEFKGIKHPIKLMVPIRRDINLFINRSKEMKWFVMRLK